MYVFTRFIIQALFNIFAGSFNSLTIFAPRLIPFRRSDRRAGVRDLLQLSGYELCSCLLYAARALLLPLICCR